MMNPISLSVEFGGCQLTTWGGTWVGNSPLIVLEKAGQFCQ